MEFKKIMPILIVLVMVGALIGVQSASAATSLIVLFANSHDKEPFDAFSSKYEVTDFNSTANDECLEIYARLYFDGE